MIPFKKPEKKRARHRLGGQKVRHRCAVRLFSGLSVEGSYAHTRKAAPIQAIKRYTAARYAEFERGVHAGEALTALCSRLYISKNTANNWLRQMRLDSLTALRACGVNAVLIAETIQGLLEA
jgi:hypothetical protein